MMKKFQRAVSVIELMIVVAIVGILGAISIPFYQGYIARAKMAEISALMAAVKTTIAEEYRATGEMPSLATDPIPLRLESILERSEYIVDETGATYDRTSETESTLTLTVGGVGGGADGKSLVYTFTASSSAFTVSCAGGAGFPARLLPRDC